MSLRDKYTDEEWEELELKAKIARKSYNRLIPTPKNEEYQRIVIRQDDSGHDYVIPFEKSERFDEVWDNEDLFEEEFEQYRCEGDPFGEYEFYIKMK